MLRLNGAMTARHTRRHASDNGMRPNADALLLKFFQMSDGCF